MTFGEAKTRTLKLMGEYSYMGKKLSETENDTADWRLRLPELIDDAQRAAAEICPVWRRREIAHYPPRNRAKGNNGILIHADKDIIVEAADVRAFSFRVMGSFTVYLEQSGEMRWQVLRTGADLRLKCLGCGHEIMVPRFKAEKNIRTVSKSENSST